MHLLDCFAGERKRTVRGDFKVFARAARRVEFTEMEKTVGGAGFEEEDRNSFWTYLRCLSHTQVEKYMNLKFRGEVEPEIINLRGVRVFME